MGYPQTKESPISTAKAMGILFYKPAFHLAIIIVLGLLAYSNTFFGPFQWDESEYILANPVVRDLGYFMDPSRAEGLDIYGALKTRYVGFFTFALNYKLHGFNVFGYHVVNLAIHLINAILVYFLVLLTFRTPCFAAPGTGDQGPGISNKGRPVPGHQSRVTTFFALAVSLLFVAHPIQTEAVTYVFQRFASLVSLFYLLSLVLYIKGRLTNQRQVEAKVEKKVSASALTCFILSFISAVLAMKTKENAFTLPVVITLYEFLFFNGPIKKRVIRLAPFLLTMLIIPITVIESGSSAGEVISVVKNPGALGLQDMAGEDYFYTQFRVIITYIRLLFFPVGQSLFHDYPVYRSFLEQPVFLSFLFLAALFGLAMYLLYKTQRAISYQQSAASSKQSVVSSKKDEAENDGPGTDDFSLLTTHYSRLIAFGILWFFITLSVESSIIPIAMVIDEYRVYLPSVGFFIAIMSGATILVTSFTQKAPSGSPSGVEVIPSDSVSPSLKIRGGKGEVMIYEGEGVSERRGGNTLHTSLFTKAAVAAFVVIVLILASATYARNSVWKDKISLWEDVVSKSPNFPLGYINLGLAYYEKKLYNEAIAMHTRAVALLPVYLDAYINLGVAYSAAGKTDLAIETYRTALAMYPNNSTLYFNLAHAYAAGGLPEKAVENFLISIQFDPYNPNAYHGLGTVYVRLGRLEDALGAYSKFVMLNPDNPEAYRNRGIVYSAKDDLINARADFGKSCALGDRESCGYLENSGTR